MRTAAVWLRDTKPTAEPRHANTVVPDLAQDMAGEQDGAALAGQRAQEVAEPADGLGIEAVGGLVEDEQARVADQGAGEAEALADPERVAAVPPVGGPGQLDKLQELVHAGA